MSPDEGARARDLMFIYQKTGDAYLTLDKIDAAIAEYLMALSLIQNVLVGSPENRLWQRDLANTLRRIGQALYAKGDFAGALEQLNSGLEIITKLAQEDRSQR
jgi:tetratricopeptide (TPR) repeat protein